MDKERREFKVGELKLYVRRPTLAESQQADLVYSRNYTKFLKEDIPLAEELDTILKKKGMFGEDYKKRRQEAAEKLAMLQIESEKEENKDKKQEFSVSIRVAKQDLINIGNEYSKHFSNTVESRADSEKRNYLLSVLIEKEDGTPYWASVEALGNESDPDVFSVTTEQMIYFLNNIPQNYFDENFQFESKEDRPEEKTQESVAV